MNHTNQPRNTNEEQPQPQQTPTQQHAPKTTIEKLPKVVLA
jgi:hypothetical protein